MPRVSWDDYFLGLARAVAERGTCPRKRVGCVLVKDKQVLCTGYNGAVSGAPHCDDVGCLMENSHCTRTVHAEASAIAQAAKHGVSVKGATAYVTCTSCRACEMLLLNAGVVQILAGEVYP